MPVTLRIYDVTGRVVAVLVDEVRGAGEHQDPIRRPGACRAVCICTNFSTPQTRITRKMMLVK